MLLIFLIFIYSCLLHAADIAATLDSSNGTSAFIFKDSAGNSMSFIDSDGNIQLKGGLRLDSSGTKCATAEMLIVDGKLGVGTDIPNSQIHAYQSSNAQARIVIDCEGSQDSQASVLQFISKGNGNLVLGQSGTLGWWLGSRSDAYSNPDNRNDLHLFYWNGNSYTLLQHWDHEGNIGFGTLSPSASLEVAGNGVFQSGLRLDASGTACSTAEMLIVDGKTGIGTPYPEVPLHIKVSSGAELLRLEDSGASSLNDANPRLDFYGYGTDLGYLGYGSTGNSDLALVNYVPGALRFFTNSLERVFISASGEVGINTNNPAVTLDVNGRVRGSALYNVASDTSTRSTTSTSSTWENNLALTLSVKNNDLVFVILATNMYNSAGSSSYMHPDLYSGSASAVLYPNHCTIATTTWGSGVSFGLWRATADGTLDFRSNWHTGSGTVYCVYRNMLAMVIGKY